MANQRSEIKGQDVSEPEFFRTPRIFVAPHDRQRLNDAMLFLCQHGFESLLERELNEAGVTVVEKERGWARAEPIVGDAIKLSLAELAFPQLIMTSIYELRGESVNALAQQLADFFLESLRGERLDAAWPCVFQTVAEVVGLGRRASAVEKAFGELLKKKLSRVARLAT
jgi:23S rRNA (cytidine2498-2'-O)-methyltransferase